MADINEHIQSLHTVKDHVRHCLEMDERCRNDDLWLIISVWRLQGAKIYLDYNDMKRISSFESIRRCRQLIQNTEGKLQPTDLQVILARDVHRKAVKAFILTNTMH